jgi:hypothetical protein
VGESKLLEMGKAIGKEHKGDNFK